MKSQNENFETNFKSKNSTGFEKVFYFYQGKFSWIF